MHCQFNVLYVMQFEFKYFVCYTILYHKLKVKEICLLMYAITVLITLWQLWVVIHCVGTQLAIITLDQHCLYVLRADLSTGDRLCPEITAFSQKRLEQNTPLTAASYCLS